MVLCSLLQGKFCQAKIIAACSEISEEQTSLESLIICVKFYLFPILSTILLAGLNLISLIYLFTAKSLVLEYDNGIQFIAYSLSPHEYFASCCLLGQDISRRINPANAGCCDWSTSSPAFLGKESNCKTGYLA